MLRSLRTDTNKFFFPGVGRYFITAANNHYLVQWHNQFTENVPIDKERVQRVSSTWFTYKIEGWVMKRYQINALVADIRTQNPA
jgi:hypothetical protein